jgi:hypothetical protein
MSSSAPTGELAPYEAILAHAELELELAGRGDVDGLSTLAERWEELTSGLPATAPPAARGLIERAQLIGERARIELIRVRDGLLVESAAALRAKRAADGYGRELQHPPHLDRNA